jgi:hypothetical protein
MPLDEVYDRRRNVQFTETITGQQNPFAGELDRQKTYRQELRDLSVMLSDREALGGIAPEVVDLSEASYDPQLFKDMAVNWRATAFLLDTPVEQLKDSDYTLYKKLVAAKLGKNAPKTEQEYHQMLGEHFGKQTEMDKAVDDLNAMAVIDALNSTNYGQDFPMVRDQGRSLAAWMEKYPDLATPDRQWLLARSAGEMYQNTLRDLADVRQYAAPTFKTLVDFTRGKATQEQIDELGRNLRDLTPEQFTKVGQYVTLAAETEQIDRGAWSQLAKNLGESLSRGFDFIPQGDLQLGQSQAQGRLDAVQKDEVWVPVDSERLPVGTYQDPRTAQALPKYLQMAAFGESPDIGQEGSPAWRKATGEEKEAIRKNAEDGVKSISMVRKLRNLAKTGVDPIRPLSQGGLIGAVERGAYGLMGSLPLMGAVAVNPFLGVFSYQSMEFDRIMLENEGMDIRAAQGLALFEGSLNAVIDQFQIAALMGRAKIFGGVLKGMQGRGVANYLKRAGVIQLEQFTQENIQDLIAPVTEYFASALREDMPDQDFVANMKVYWETRPEVFFAVLPFALIGGGFASSGDLRNISTTMTRERLRGAGITEEKIDYILAATDKAEFDARFREAWNSRTNEDIESGVDYLNEQLGQLQQTNLDHRLSVERKADGTPEWIVTDTTGAEVGRFADYDAAAEVVSQNVAANLQNEKGTTAELLNFASKILQNPSISMDEKPVSVAQEMERMQGIGDEKGLQNLMNRLKFGDLQGKDPNKLFILGETTIEQVKDGVYRAVIKLKENASPLDALEEINHGFFKTAVANGVYTFDQYKTWLEQTEKATGKTLKRDSEMDIIESLARVTEDYILGRIDDTSMPQSFLDYIKRIAQIFKEAVLRYLKMEEAFAKGEIDTDFKTALEQSLGIDSQVRLDRIRDETAASVDPNLSVRDTSGDPDERASDPATESGDPAPDVKIDEIDPDKQTGKEWKEIPWSDDWNYSVRVLPTSFVPMDAKLFAKIKKESGGIIRSVFIDRMKAGGEYLGIPLQGGMGFPSIVENLKAGVGWAFNSRSTARALYNRAMDSGGYLALSIMVEGNVIGNKSFAMMWFEQLRQNIAAGKLTNAKALAELNRVREKYVTKKADATRHTDIQKQDKNGKLKFNKDGSPVFEKEKIQATDAEGNLLFTRKGNPAWVKTDKKFTGHSTPWKSLAEAEKAIVGMPQGKRGSAYFKKTFNKKKNQADYQELLTKANTKAGFPDAVNMVKDVEEPSFAGLPAQTIVGIIKIEKVSEGTDPAMTAKQLGVPEHKSYGFILKGKPVARMMKFRTLAEVKPSIAKEMMTQDNERWKMDDLIAYSVKETKKSADEIEAIVSAMSASDIRAKLESSKLTPTPRMVAMLGEFPQYLEPIVEYMMEKRQDLVDGTVSPRDVAKAYWMTIASIGADAIDVSTIAAKAQAEGISFNPDAMFTTTGTRGQLQMRPEELAAYWLGTPEGQRALDNVEQGNFNATDWETGLLLRDAFGRNDLREKWRVTGKGTPNTNQTIVVDGADIQVQVNAQGNWSFPIDNQTTPVDLPDGMTEGNRIQNSGSVGLPKEKKANLTNLKELTDRINAANGNPAKLEKAVMSAVGIGEGKKGFISHFLGFGEWSTIDAVELNMWLAGVGDTTRATEDQKMIAAIAKKASGQAATRRDLFERIREAIIGLRDKAKGGDKIPKEVAPHIIHHWIWDAAKNIQTTHEGLYYAMQNYSVREITPQQDADYLAAVERGDMDTAQRMVDEAANAAGYRIKGYHGTPNEKFTKFRKGKTFLTPNKIDARQYGSTIFPLFIRIQNPQFIDYNFTPDNEGPNGVGVDYDSEEAKQEGYDGVIFQNIDSGFRTESSFEQIVVFSPEQVKSADPVTYDDAGEIIPLSERFDASTGNINYSVRETPFTKQNAVKNRDILAKRFEGFAPQVGVSGLQYGWQRPSDGKFIRVSQHYYFWRTDDGEILGDPNGVGYLRIAKSGNVLMYQGDANPRQLKELKDTAIEEGLKLLRDPSETSYSIRDQEEIDRVAAELDKVNRGPEGRLAVYERAKQRFLRLMQENKEALDAIREARVLDPSPTIEMLEQDRAGQLADIETEEVAEVESALQDNAVQFATRIDEAIDPEDKAQLKADARDRANILEKGIREKYAERKKRVNDQIAAQKAKVEREAETGQKSNSALYREKVRSEKLRQAIAELDGLLKVLPKEVIGKVGGFATLANIGTGDKALADFFVKRVEMVDQQLERYLKNEYDEQLDKIFDRAKPKKGKAGEKPKGIDADLQRLFAELKKARTMNGDEVSAHLAKLDFELANTDMTPEQEAANKQEAALVTLVGDWKNADSNRRAAAVDALRETYARGYALYVAREIAKREARKQGRAEAIVSTGKTGDINERKKRYLKDAGLGGKFRSALFNLVGWDQFLGLVFGNESSVANKFSDAQRRADNQKEDSIQRKTDAIEDLFTRLAGGSRLEGEKLRFAMSQPSMAVNGLPLSQMEGLTATMMWMQEDGKRHMEGQRDESGVPTTAWAYDQKFVDKIEGALSPEAREVRQFLLDNYDQEYQRINAVYRQLNGIDLPRIQFYSPLIVAPQNAPQGMVNDPVTGMAVSAASISPGALRTRSRMAVAEPQFRDALQTFIAHTRQMEHWLAYAPFITDLNGILRNREVQNAIEEKGGDQAKRVLNLWLDLFAQGGNRDASNQLGLSEQINSMAGRGAQVALVGRIGTLIIQATQLGAAVAEMPVGSYAVRLSKLFAGQLGWGAALNSPYIQRRIAEMPPIVQQALQGLAETQPNRLKFAVTRIGQLISGTDGLMTAGTFAIVYDYHLTQAKKMGFSEADAQAYAANVAERATDRIAQPTRMGARSIFELTNTGPFAKVGWAFASEMRKNLALAVYSAVNRPAGDAARTIGGFLLLNVLFGAFLRNAWRDARDDEDDEWFDEKNWSGKRLILALATEPFYGLPILGGIIEEGAYAAAGEFNMSGTVLSPVRAIRAISNLPDTLSGNREVEDMLKDLNGLLSVMGLFNQNLAAAASISTLASDLFGLGKNAKKELEE